MLKRFIKYLLYTILILPGLVVVGLAADPGGVGKALLVIDIQEYYAKNFETTTYESFITGVNKVLEKAANKNILTVYIYHQDEVVIQPPDQRVKVISKNVYIKTKPSAFTHPKLDKFLKANKVKQLYITGLDAAYGVYDTATDAKNLGYEVALIQDASISRIEGDSWHIFVTNYDKSGIKILMSHEVF